MENFRISYLELHGMMKESKTNTGKEIMDRIVEIYSHLSDEDIAKLKAKISRFAGNYNKRLKDCNRKYDRLMETNSKWLQDNYVEIDSTSSSRTPKKRTLKDFGECSEKQKKRRSESLLEEHSEDLIEYTAKNLRKNKEPEEIVHSSDSDKDKAALALFISLKLTVDKWRQLRQYVVKYGDHFPEYRKLMEEKRKCYPEDIEVSEDI